MTEEINNLIPVADVIESAAEPTEVTREQVHAEGRRGVEAILGKGSSYLMISVGPGEAETEAALDIVAACTDAELKSLVVAAVSMLGVARLGASVQQMPPDLARAMSLAMGMQDMQAYLKQQIGDKWAPATPAADIAVETKH